jgi:hypothetical protein
LRLASYGMGEQHWRCPACNALIPPSRREAHVDLWCEPTPTSPHPQSATVAVAAAAAAAAEPTKEVLPRWQQLPSGQSVASWSGTRAQSMLDVRLGLGVGGGGRAAGGAGPLPLRFEQRSVFDHGSSTAGALWRAELLLAEWCAAEVLAGTRGGAAGARQGSGGGSPLRVLELGCGAAPAAGLACVAMGCDVLLTDLAAVLPLVEANLQLNAAALAEARRHSGSRGAGGLSRSSCVRR